MLDSTNLPEVDINQIATDLNNKMDRDGVSASCPTLLSRTANSYGGVVEIWSDGYCVQTGISSVASASQTGTTINLDETYKDTSFIAIGQAVPSLGDAASQWWRIFRPSNSSIRLSMGWVNANSMSYTTGSIMWRTEGYIR